MEEGKSVPMTTQDTEAGKIPETVTSAGLIMRATYLRQGVWEGSESTARHLELAAAELDRLVAIKDELVRALEEISSLDVGVGTFRTGRRVKAACETARAALVSARSQEKTNG